MTASRSLKVRACLMTFAFLAGMTAVEVAAQSFERSHLRAAREAIAAAQADAEFDTLLPMIAEQAKTLFIRSNPAATRDIEEAVDDVAIQLASRRPALDREIQEIWAARLTEEELNEIADFYRSPTGQKFGENMGLLIQESYRTAEEWRDELSSELLTQARAALNEQGYDF